MKKTNIEIAVGALTEIAKNDPHRLSSAGAIARSALADIHDAPAQGSIDTKAERIINRLMSSDPDHDDCTDAADLIRELTEVVKGPDGFATWKEAAIAERMRRVHGYKCCEHGIHFENACGACIPARGTTAHIAQRAAEMEFANHRIKDLEICCKNYHILLQRAASADVGIDSSDRERLLYAARVLRGIADLGHVALGELWGEAVMGVSAIKCVLNIKDEDCETLGLQAAPKANSVPGKTALFPITVLGTPMREHAPGKWESAEWPSERAASADAPFGMYVEREDGTSEFQRTGKAFQGTAHGYKVWTLYAAPAPIADETAHPCKLGGGCMCATEHDGVSETCKYYAAPKASAPDARAVAEADQRTKMEARFANRPRTAATADFDLPAPNDAPAGDLPPLPAALHQLDFGPHSTSDVAAMMRAYVIADRAARQFAPVDRYAEKLRAVWADLSKMIEENTGKPCSSEPFDDLAALLAARAAVAPAGHAEPVAYITRKNLVALKEKGMAYATGFMAASDQIPLYDTPARWAAPVAAEPARALPPCVTAHQFEQIKAATEQGPSITLGPWVTIKSTPRDGGRPVISFPSGKISYLDDEAHEKLMTTVDAQIAELARRLKIKHDRRVANIAVEEDRRVAVQDRRATQRGVK